MSEERRSLECPVCGHLAVTSSIGQVYCGPHERADGAYTPAVPMVARRTVWAEEEDDMNLPEDEEGIASDALRESAD